MRYQDCDTGGVRAVEGVENSNTAVLIKVSVPFNMVGLVVGNRGSRVKWIEMQTNTYIKTPSKNREPVFEIIGEPEHVMEARNMIDAVIKLRLEEDYIKSVMPQMPIHEPGSPVKLTPVFPLPPNLAGVTTSHVQRLASPRSLPIQLPPHNPPAAGNCSPTCQTQSLFSLNPHPPKPSFTTLKTPPGLSYPQ